MKTKTILELVTLATSIYYFAKDTELLERINKMSEKGKDNLNEIASETQLDEEGNEMEFIDKVVHKAGQLKTELEDKIEDSVVKFYKKANIAHLDEIRALNEKLEQADMSIALLEARLNKLEIK